MLVVNEEIVIPEGELQFSYSRSSGPGGQNVNKVNSKVQLRWNPASSTSFPAEIRQRLLARYSTRLTADGDLLFTSDETRDRRRNQELCLEKLRQLVLSVARPPKVRKKTRPSRSSKEKRRNDKRKRGEHKRNRQKVGLD
jgi:ribosome-associated protein